MHLIVDHIPIEPPARILVREAAAVCAQKALQRFYLLWPEYRYILLACTQHVGAEIVAPRRWRPLLRTYLTTLRAMSGQYTADNDLRAAGLEALRTLCADIGKLQVTIGGMEWDPITEPFPVWRQTHCGPLCIRTRQNALVAQTQAESLYTRLTTTTSRRRRTHGRR